MQHDEAVADLEQQLVLLFRRWRSLSGTLAREVHPGIEPGAYALLLRLDDEGTQRLTDLAAAFGVGKPTLSRQVAVLERLGLVERTPDPRDARASRLRLTPVGAERLHAARSARRERFRELLSPWPDQDVADLARLLERFNALED